MADKESKSSIPPWRAVGLAGRIAHGFIDSKLTPLVIVAALLIGAFSILKTPRKEEPQIVVPMLDVFVQMPGASAEEVEQRVSVPTEKLLRDVPGVEYVYSISHPGLRMLIVRFYVGSKEENAIVQTYNKLYSNLDRIPPGAIATHVQHGQSPAQPAFILTPGVVRSVAPLSSDALEYPRRCQSEARRTFRGRQDRRIVNYGRTE
jgi:multidrug efflux pump subunit AcrB